MSALPLPPLPVTPAPAPAPSPAPTWTSQSGNSAFNTHLQNVQQQQQQQQQSASEAQDASQQAAARQNNSQAASGTQDKSATKPGDDASNDNAQSSDASDDSSIPTGVASLANAVLNLIDQATGDTGKGKTASANSGKPAGTKPANQANDKQAAGSAQALGMVAPQPPPVAQASAGKGDDKTANGNGTVALQANSKNTQGGLAASLQKAANSADDSDDDGDTKAVGAAGDNTATAQSAGDSSQAFASALSAVSHAATGQADTTASAAGSSSSTPDLSSLHGVADAAAVVTPPVTPTIAAHALSVNAPVGSSGFAKELGHQVTWLSGQDIKQAQIKLNPQNLGPLDVKVSIEHGRVDVAFMTQHAATATAVQQGLDQLHQMLGGQGLSLGHTSVGQHASQQQFEDQQRQQSGAQMAGDSDQAVGSSADETLKRVAVGLVDAFA